MAGRFAPLRRGLRRRCPRCGERDIFASFFELHETCPRCDYTFVREEGYWLGAMAVAFGLVETIFGLVFVGGIVLTYPDVPWNALLIVGLALNAIVPIVLYPWAKSVWMGLHTSFVPSALHEEPERHTPGRPPKSP